VMILLGVQSFAKTASTTGAIAGGLEMSMIVLMFWQAKKKGDRIPEYTVKANHLLGIILLILFATGAAFQIWNII